MTSSIKRLVDPKPQDIPEDTHEFLRWLGGPAVITLTGEDVSRCRMAVTLLHGNEPSGAKAAIRLIKEATKPTVTLHLLIAGVDIALTEPIFSHRQLPGHRDLNRCFKGPVNDQPGILAKAILATIDVLKPEAIVDIHNTSGNGPAFSLSSHLGREYFLLCCFFTHRVIVTDLKMGTLMEISSPDMPVVTIECGGAGGLAADHYAYSGLKQFALADELFAEHSQLEDIDMYLHPVRLELTEQATIAYGSIENPVTTADVTLPADIDRCNFGVVEPDIPLAWLRHPESLHLKAGDGYHPLDSYFDIRNNLLYPCCKLKLFMVTTYPAIAKSDCILYAVKEIEHSHFLTH